MSVLELCDADVASVQVEVSVADAIRLMLDRHVGAVGVVDSEGRVAGIFSERDVLRKLSLTGRDPEVTPVRELMTTPVELATISTRPGEALAIMLERHFGICRSWTTAASCWACFPSATCWSSGSMISATNWTHSSNTSLMTDPGARPAWARPKCGFCLASALRS